MSNSSQSSIAALIKSAVADRRPCYFISPHLDDAIYSSAALISYLAGKNVPVHIVTVFTEANDGPETLSAQKFVRNCGYRTAAELFADRRTEDMALCNKLKVIGTHLGFVDASWRRLTNLNPLRSVADRILPEFGHLYPIYRMQIRAGHMHPQDQSLAEAIGRKLAKLTPPVADSLVFCPVGIGRHVDHIIIRDLCTKLYQPIYWSDFPYVTYAAPEADYVTSQRLTAYEWTTHLDRREDLIRGYDSQTQAVFGTKGVPQVSEIYYR